MSYCDPTWTSDYTYWNIFHYRNSLAVQPVETSQAQEAVFVSGVISPEGEVTLRPVYRQTVTSLDRPDGPFNLQMLAKGDRVLASYSFTALEIPEAPGFRSFGFFVPDSPELSGLRVEANGRVLAEKRVGEAPHALALQSGALDVERSRAGTSFAWSPVSHSSSPVVYRVRISLDAGQTWQVIAIDSLETKISISGVDLQGAWLEVQASDGIHTSTRLFKPIP
jgi:hypothetical protein